MQKELAEERDVEAERKQRFKEHQRKIEEMVFKKLKSHLRSKIEQLKDNPNKILMKDHGDKDVPGKPYVSAVQIKIVSTSST